MIEHEPDESGEEKAMRNTNRHLVLALSLAGAPALLARASDVGELSSQPPRSDRATVVAAPEAELHALYDTLKRFDRTEGSDDIGALSSASSARERTHVAAAEAELRALDDTLARSTATSARRDANAPEAGRSDGTRAPLAYAPEAELDALLAWQRPQPVPGPAQTESNGRGVATAQLEGPRRASGCTCMR